MVRPNGVTASPPTPARSLDERAETTEGHRRASPSPQTKSWRDAADARSPVGRNIRQVAENGVRRHDERNGQHRSSVSRFDRSIQGAPRLVPG